MTWVCKRAGTVDIELDVSEIVGKGRPRFTRLGKPYTPAKTAIAERIVREGFAEAAGDRYADFTGPVSVSVKATRELARSNPKDWAGRTDMMKPDIDNVLKLVLDALNGIAYHDDSQVMFTTASKGSRTPHGTGNKLHITVRYYSETRRGKQ